MNRLAGFSNRSAFVATITVVVWILFTSPSSACKCKGLSVTDALQHSDSVFLGRVVETKLDVGQRDYSATFEVFKSWKGVSSPRTQVSTEVAGEACGSEFLCGKTYLVYVKAGRTNACLRTIGAGRAANDISELGEPTYVNKSAIAW